MYNKICLMLPTYGRSGTLLPTFINSAIQKAKKIDNIIFCFCVNSKDKPTLEYLNLREWPEGFNRIIVKEDTDKPNLAKYFNLMYKATESLGLDTAVSMLGDDMEFITDGYDEALLSLINSYDGVGVFYCNDNYIAQERLCVNLFVTRKFVDATEEPFMCEKYPADMIDYVWQKVGKYTKSLHYLPNIIIQHNHNTKRKPQYYDETFKRLRPAQAVAHEVYGKKYAKELAAQIATRLVNKGMVGDNA